MDMSIAIAFYFAARGQGYEVHPDRSRTTYTTPAKVFFSGLGADEQLGYFASLSYDNILISLRGYSRHAVTWRRSNGDWNAIIQEVLGFHSLLTYVARLRSDTPSVSKFRS
jgi:asparagine synthetase B (glutamine-hydrolysing)